MMDYKFFDEVHDFQRFVRQNIRLLGNYLIISEQLYVKNNETGIIDMLAVDNTLKKLVIIELKNEITTDKNVWQPLRYYDLARRGEDSFRELLLNVSSKFDYHINEIDLKPKLLLVVPKCNEQLLRALSYFDDIESEVAELTRYTSSFGTEVRKKIHQPRSIFHKEDLVNVQNKVSKIWSFNEYKNYGINRDKLVIAEKMLSQIKVLFNSKGFKFDAFFNETNITITKDGKVWGHLFVKQRPLDHKLTFSFKIPKDIVINVNHFTYNFSIESWSRQKNGVKITLIDSISPAIIEQYL